MATPAHRLVQDQNQNILYKGVTTGGKTDVAKADKSGGLGGRKALNDISNSRKPSVHPSLKKDKNIISIEKDPVTVKAKSTKATEKGKTVGRKALSDLTNSVKPPSKQVPKTGTKLNSVAEENVPSCVMEEGFLHNHQECIAAQTKTVAMDYFLKLVGLRNDIPMHLPAKGAPLLSSVKPETNLKLSEIEEMPDHHQVHGYCSPACGSPPQSPKAPHMGWEDDSLSDLMVIESP